MAVSYQAPLVALVGAGPGHPGLLTVRAVECLAMADLVVYDQLVLPRILERARAGAELVCVDTLSAEHPDRYPLIHQTLIAAARQGRRVVRLKGGDPFIFGRGGEEAEALTAAGIAYEIVPGVTAALGTAAYTGIPLTHRRHASAVAFVTGHEEPGKAGSALDWDALARFPGTLVIYMGMARLRSICAALLAAGKDQATPAVAVRWGSLGEQQLIEATLANLPDAVVLANLKAPALIMIGSVVELHRQLAWFERRPLFGKRVLVTRPRQQSAELIQQLEELGAIVSALPTVEIRRLDDYQHVDRALDRVAEYKWLVFTSVNGVQALFTRLEERGTDLRILGHVQLAAIGPATAAALRDYHLHADVVPASFRSEDLAAVLLDKVRGQRVLLARADRGRDVLREILATVAQVDQVAVYSQIDAPAADPRVLTALREGQIDLIALTSSNIARSLDRMLDPESRKPIVDGRVKLVSISPVTTEAIRELKWPIAAEATVATMDGVVDAMIEAAQQC